MVQCCSMYPGSISWSTALGEMNEEDLATREMPCINGWNLSNLNPSWIVFTQFVGVVLFARTVLEARNSCIFCG